MRSAYMVKPFSIISCEILRCDHQIVLYCKYMYSFFSAHASATALLLRSPCDMFLGFRRWLAETSTS